MRNFVLRDLCFLVAVSLIGAGQAAAAEKNLGELLRASGWDRIIGTWVDQDTKGAAVTTTYSWKYKDHVIETTSKTAAQTTTALIGRDASSGEVFQMGAGNKGGSSIGKWIYKENEAVLELVFTSAEGEQGGLKMRCVLKDDDTMIVTLDIGQPIEFTMIRETK